MENFNKLPDSKDKHQQSNQETDLTEHEKRQEELNKRLSSIFPYFKQVMSSDNRSKSKPLPEDLSTIDQQKRIQYPD
ncbi:hypothetical protein G5B10_13845 [Fluviicola sp. SGL-29]|nr:hypothetical protein [Fluviicola sp. SGL-29]